MTNLTNKKKTILAALTGLVIGAQANAAVLTVNNSNDEGQPGELRTTIAAARDGDIIQFDADRISIALERGPIVIDKDITIRGNGAERTVINGVLKSRIFTIEGSNRVVEISGLTLERGNETDQSAWGGAIFVRGGNNQLVLDKMIFSQNAAPNGGAVSMVTDGADKNSLVIKDTTFEDNRAFFEYGGGISTQNTVVQISGSTFVGNSALFGGGASIRGGSAEIVNSTFSMNQASRVGGGLALQSLRAKMAFTTVTHNIGRDSGGGVFIGGTDLRFTGNIIADNVANSFPDLQAGRVMSLGYNLIGKGAGSTSYAPTDLVGTPEKPLSSGLGPLAKWNNQVTATRIPQPGSLAIGLSANCTDWNSGRVELDQAGNARPASGSCSAGSAEPLRDLSLIHSSLYKSDRR